MEPIKPLGKMGTPCFIGFLAALLMIWQVTYLQAQELQDIKGPQEERHLPKSIGLAGP